MEPRPPKMWESIASSSVSASVRPVRIRPASSPIPPPAPEMAREREPCRSTDRAYSSTGTVVKRLAARNPFRALRAVSLILALPLVYSMAQEKAATTRPVP